MEPLQSKVAVEKQIQKQQPQSQQLTQVTAEQTLLTQIVTGSKGSLCRYFLRGLCVFKRQDCKYAHGVDDLQGFLKYSGEEVVYEYKKTDFDQSKLIPKERRYINLYEYQQEKIHSEEVLNSDRKLREKVRNCMIKDEAEKFWTLLLKLYPEEEQPFSEKFLEREFTRAGFNKPTTTINFKRICDYITNFNSFQSKFMVVQVNKKSLIVQKLSKEEIEQEYTIRLREALEKLPQNAEVTENELKKIMYKPNIQGKALRVPTMMYWLKGIDMSFMEYMHILIGRDQTLQEFMLVKGIQFQGEANIDQITEYALKQIQQIGKSIIFLDQFMTNISNYFKINNNNQIAPLKEILIKKGFKIYFLPMGTFIYNQNAKVKYTHKTCPCTYKQKPDLSRIHVADSKPLLDREVVVIDSHSALSQSLEEIVNSHVLAVDLEGRLRKNGHLEMIQLNNGSHVFLLDIYKIIQIDFDFELFANLQLVIRKVMLDEKIVKIFHDSRHDCLSLHEIMNTCIVNVFDTSGMEILRVNNDLYSSKKNNITNAMINQLSNIKTAGLNELLSKYSAPHGINPNKQKFHSMMGKAHLSDIFTKRPLDPDYKEYCVKDVLDLIHLYIVMSEGIPDEIIRFVGDSYVEEGYNRTL